MSSLDEMRTNQNPPYKKGGTKIGSVLLRDEWMGIPKPRVVCKWSLNSPISFNWVGYSPWMNWRAASTQCLPSMLARTMSSGEIIIIIFKYPGYKHSTEDLEEDLYSWHQRRKVVKPRGWLLQVELRTFSWLLSRLT